MRSILAAFKSLTLPAGTTTGERIVLDGIAGEIRIYDAANNLVIQIDGESGFQAFKQVFGLTNRIISIDDTGINIYDTANNLLITLDADGGLQAYDVDGHMLVQVDNGGLTAYDTAGHPLIVLNPSGLFVYDTTGVSRASFGEVGSGASYSGFNLWTAGVGETDSGVITLQDNPPNINRLVLTPGERGNQGALELALQCAPASNSRAPMIQVVGVTLQSGNRPPLVDLTGASAPAGKEVTTVVGELYFGLSGGWGFEPTLDKRIPRGFQQRGTSTGNIPLNNTAGLYTEIVRLSDWTYLYAGHRYKVSYWNGGGNLLINGSGFSTADTWDYKFQRYLDATGGPWTDVLGGLAVCRLQVAAATRQPLMFHCNDYVATVDGFAQFALVARKASGAGTVTSSFDGGTNVITVEDMGS